MTFDEHERAEEQSDARERIDPSARESPTGPGDATGPDTATELGSAADSITASRTSSGGASAPAGGGLRQHLRRNQEVYGVATALIGSVIAMASVWFALWQFEQQMEAQQKSTAVQLVNEFFKQVGELKAIEGADAGGVVKVNANRFVVSRAQMLLDSNDTAIHADDIVRFLAANGYGEYFGRSPGDEGQRINISHSELAHMKLIHARFDKANLACVDFSDALFENVAFSNSWISYSSLRSVRMASVDFSETEFSHVDFSGTRFVNKPIFEGASLFRSNLTGIELSDAFLDETSNAESVPDAERERIKYRNFAAVLARAKTLYLTRLDEAVDRELKLVLGKDYEEKVKLSPYAATSSSPAASFLGVNAIPLSDPLEETRCRQDGEEGGGLVASLLGGWSAGGN